MDIIDVSPDDLVLPGDCLGGSVADFGVLPCLWRYLWQGEKPRWYQAVLSDGRVLSGRDSANAGEEAANIRLDCRHPEVRDRLRRVLAAGERCSDCMGYLGDEDGQCAACMPGPDGAGYTRQPHNLAWLTNAEIAGRITPRVAAGLWWASVLQVEAGLGPVRETIPGPWRDDGDGVWQRHRDMLAWESYDASGNPDVGWLSMLDHPEFIDGPETGDAGKLAADTAALSAGFALLNADHILLPLPDRIARLRLED